MVSISIRKFTLLGICLGTALLFSCYIFLNSFLLTQTFTDFEYNALANDVVRASNALEEEVHKLDEVLVDWAIWDDSALFMQGKMKSFVKSNLNDRTLDSLRLSFIMFVDNKGKIIWTRCQAPVGADVSDTAQELQDLVFNKTSILADTTQDNRIHGIANLKNQLMLLASCPILDSEAKGPSRGILLMGRQLTEATLEKLSEKMRLKFDLERNDEPLSDRFHTLARTVTADADAGPVDIYEVDQDNLIGLMRLADIAGKKSLRLAVLGDKDILHRGAAVTTRSSILLALGGLILIGAVLFLVERRILSRVLSIKRQILANNSAGGESGRIVIAGNDEINTLANQINAYIEEINNYRHNLEQLVDARTNDLRQKILENEQAQRELKQAKEFAEKANNLKTEFLAKVTHEIRTPMNSIQGMNEYLLSTPVNAEQIECLEVIKESSSHLLTIVDDLLDLSKIEAGQLTFEHIDFNLKELIDSTIKILHPLAQKKKLGLKVDYPSPADIVVKSDPSRIRQILFNLAYNALKFTQTGDVRIIVATAWNASGQAYDITITVKDTGIGITEDALSRIFEPFIQSDNSITRKFGGTGLGLTICRQLATLMGGTIEVSSQAGIGSSFTVRLSLEKGAGELAGSAVAAAPDRQAALDRLMILVVDDNELNLHVAKKVFSLINQEPVLAHGGQEALALLRTALFDVIFLDIEMPEINGIELTRMIRAGEAAPLNQDAHIVAMTAYSLDTIKNECLKQGMDDYITKPLDPDVLLKKLQSLSQHPMQSPTAAERAAGSDQPWTALPLGRDLSILNAKSALRKLGDDTELYLTICEDFLEKYTAARLDQASGGRAADPRSLPLFIHALKGISLQIGAERISSIAQRLEGKLVDATSDVSQELLVLKEQIVLAEDTIRAFVRESQEERAGVS